MGIVMKTNEIIAKILEFYNRPDTLPGYDRGRQSCSYALTETRRCAFGCVLPYELAEQLGKRAHFDNVLGV
jgi:hypothetical protein